MDTGTPSRQGNLLRGGYSARDAGRAMYVASPSQIFFFEKVLFGMYGYHDEKSNGVLYLVFAGV